MGRRRRKIPSWLIQSGGGGSAGKESVYGFSSQKDKNESFFDLLYQDSERFFYFKLPNKNGKSVCIIQFFCAFVFLLQLKC